MAASSDAVEHREAEVPLKGTDSKEHGIRFSEALDRSIGI